MKKLALLVIPLLIIALFSGAFGCGEEESLSTPTPEPSATLAPTATPESIDWVAVSDTIDRLAADNGLNLHDVHQITADIVEVGGAGGCTDFLNAVDNEPQFVIVGTPQLSPDGNCTIWFRVLLGE
jgi:hypothetical protein